MKTCADCRYNDFPYICDERSIPPCMGCIDWRYHKRKTNADKIRLMSEEELAGWLSVLTAPRCDEKPETRKKKWLNWLNMEALE